MKSVAKIAEAVRHYMKDRAQIKEIIDRNMDERIER